MGEVEKRSLSLFSEGTRIAADLFTPHGDRPDTGWPAILLCHGWGGLKEHLNVYARRFAAAGYMALTLDYRGWGESDGRVVAMSDAPPLMVAGEVTMKVRILREIVDPIDQVADIRACLAVLAAEPGVDPARIAIWGSSFGGGHAVWIAGNDDRIACAVAQIGGYDLPAQYRPQGRARAIDKALGRIDPAVPQGIDRVGELKGTPDLARMREHSQLDAAARIRVPTLFIDAEFEELNNRLENGWFAHLTVRQNGVPTEYVTFPGKHYDVYDAYFEPSVAQALRWFGTHL